MRTTAARRLVPAPDLSLPLRRACCVCRRVEQPDGSFREEVLPDALPVSDVLCLPCFDRLGEE